MRFAYTSKAPKHDSEYSHIKYTPFAHVQIYILPQLSQIQEEKNILKMNSSTS